MRELLHAPMPCQIQRHVALCLIIRRPSEGALVWADKGLQLTNGSDYRDQHRDLALEQNDYSVAIYIIGTPLMEGRHSITAQQFSLKSSTNQQRSKSTTTK